MMNEAASIGTFAIFLASRRDIASEKARIALMSCFSTTRDLRFGPVRRCSACVCV